jgi:hypothetical protein
MAVSSSLILIHRSEGDDVEWCALGELLITGPSVER